MFIEISDYDNAWRQISELIKSKANEETNLKFQNRVITTGGTTAYLKISEGCSNACTYCAIPAIRGVYKSRKFEDIIEEAKILVQKGIKEIIVVAQDTTKYGIDIYGKARLPELLRELSKIDGVIWVRFLYSYPESITAELIEEVKTNDKICKYFDIPIQHISNEILKKMNRKSTKKSIMKVIQDIRKSIPNVVIRTTLIVGFPGETKENFNELYNFVKEMEFDKLGVFSYSKEEETPAAKLDKQIHYKVKKVRNDAIMRLQNEIVHKKLQNYVGNKYKVVIDGITSDDKFYIARTYMDCPEVDGVTYIKKRDDDTSLVGRFADCVITDSRGYDLISLF